MFSEQRSCSEKIRHHNTAQPKGIILKASDSVEYGSASSAVTKRNRFPNSISTPTTFSRRAKRHRLYFEGEPAESRLSISFSPTGKLYGFAYYAPDGNKAVVDSKRKAEIAELLLSEKADQLAWDEVNEIFKDGDIDKIKLSSCNIYILPDGVPVKRYNFQTDKLIETEEDGFYTHDGNLVAIYVAATEAD